jgi:hypothetical protein
MKAADQLLALTDQLIAEGTSLTATVSAQERAGSLGIADREADVEPQRFARWLAGCRNLIEIIGSRAAPWRAVFDEDDNSVIHSRSMIGTLQAIRDAIAANLLVSVEGLAYADAFGDILRQAEYLLNTSDFVAAGVLGRAVLGEYFRKWSDRVPCKPLNPKPMLNDFKDALVTAGKLSANEADQIESLARTGNACAFNLGTATLSDVEEFLRDLRDFLVGHPLP